MIKRHFSVSSRVSSHSAIARAVRASCLAGSLTVAALAGSTGLAADSDADNAQTLQEVTVTGSLIRRTDTETASPVQVIDSAQLAHSGYDNLSSVLSNLAANGPGELSSSNSEAFAGGASGIALRGLTVGATLVLIDGHRLAPYPLSDDGERQFTDVQSIPIGAVERVEVLKDGASAIYGSDAIAGVVNIILKKEITGVHALAEEGWSQHGGGGTTHVALSAGTGSLVDDGFNAYITAEFHNQSDITLAQRQDEPWGSLNFTGQGGNNLAPGAPNVFNAGYPPTATPYLVNPTTGAVEFLGTGCNATALAAAQCTYPSQGRVLAPTQNIDVLAGVTKDFNGGWELKIRGSVFDSRGQQNGATYLGYGPTGAVYPSYPGPSYGGNVSNPLVGLPVPGVGSIANYLVPANFPGNTFGVPAYLEGVIAQLGLATIDIDSRTYRAAIDITGNVLGWDTTSSLGITKVQTHQTFYGDVNYDALYTQLTTFNAAGQPLFNPLGGNSAAELAYVAPSFTNTATDTLNYLEFDASRKLMDLPGGDLSTALGASVVDKYLDNPGPAPVLSGVQGGTFSTYAIGGQTDTAGFVELDGHLFHQLELTGALRDDYYNTYGNSLTPKFGLVWKPLDLLSVRGTLSKGFRAPAPAEIGQSATVFGLGGFQDPVLCPGGVATANGTVPASCSESIGFVQKTNPLKPEKSTSITGGFVVEPFTGFSGTFDYYHIVIDDQIVPESELPTYSFNNVNCLRGPDLAIPGVEENGQLVTAVPLAGPIAACVQGYVNAQSTKTSGFDLEGEYKYKLGGTKLSAQVTYTHVISYSLTAPDGDIYELVGTHGPSGISGDTGNQRDRINGIFSLENGPVDVAISTYWISSYHIEDPSVAGGSQVTCDGAFNGAAAFATLPVTSANSQYCSVKAFTSTNLTAAYRINHFLAVTGAIDNVFDAKAPIDAETYGGSFAPFNPAVHMDGVIGRFFRVGLKADL
jgi:iron complex outermembrane receptor protein